MVRPPLNCHRMYVGADACIGPQALRKMLFVRFYTINNVTMAKNKTLFYTEKILQKIQGLFWKNA